MICSRCGKEIAEYDAFQHLGENLCEDCYIDIRSPGKACDPWAVYTATRTREREGHTGAEGLTGLQKDIYDFIKGKGKVTGEEVLEKFGIKQTELQRHIATLRHCELVKGRKEGNSVYLVTFDYK